jgi:hypothetical protein
VRFVGSQALFPPAPRKRLGWVGKVAEANNGNAGGDGMIDLRVGSGNGGVVVFFGSQASFPPTPRCAPLSIG